MSGDAPHGSRPRLFIAFRLPADVVTALATWQRAALSGVRGIRPMPFDQFHITAVFLGSQDPNRVEWMQQTIAQHVAVAPCPIFRVDRYRETSRVGMVTLREEPLPGDHFAGRGQAVVGKLMLALEAAGLYRRENREWRPHVTMARFKDAPRLTLTPPSIAPFCPTGVTLFQSILGAGGSTYVERGTYEFRDEA